MILTTMFAFIANSVRIVIIVAHVDSAQNATIVVIAIYAIIVIVAHIVSTVKILVDIVIA